MIITAVNLMYCMSHIIISLSDKIKRTLYISVEGSQFRNRSEIILTLSTMHKKNRMYFFYSFDIHKTIIERKFLLYKWSNSE